MHPTKFAKISGITLIAIGALSLISALSSAPVDLPILELESSYGLFLGLFPMNILNKLTLIGFGIAGVWVSRSATRALPLSISYSKTLFFFMGAAAILGMIPATQTLGGYWPLFGAEVLLHGSLAILGGYFGYTLPRKTSASLRNHYEAGLGPAPHASRR